VIKETDNVVKETQPTIDGGSDTVASRVSDLSLQLLGWTVFMSAASTGDNQRLTSLLEGGMSVNTVAADGYTALHCAARAGHVHTIRFLLQHGANIESTNLQKKKRRPIHEAVLGKKHEAVSTLLEAGADGITMDEDSDDILVCVAKAGDADVAQTWLKNIQDQQRMIEMAGLLIVASIQSNAIPLLSWLLSTHPAALCHDTIVKKSPIYIATTRGHQNALKTLLLSCKATSTSTQGFVQSISRSLPRAAEIYSLEMVQMLLECKAINVNHKDTYQRTALHIAADKGATRIVELLLRHPDITTDAQQWDEKSPLHLAALKGHSDAVALLLKHHSIDVNLVDRYDKTALHYAAERDNTGVIMLLLEHPTTNVN
jgi:ankyrin repeat protein